MSFWQNPQQHFVRRVMLQIHLWTGLVSGLYAVFIGVTGAALVFGGDLQRLVYPQFFAAPPDATSVASPERVIASLGSQFPDYRFSGFEYPTDRRGTFLVYLAKDAELRTVFLDARRGTVIGELPRDAWIQQLQELHSNLLSGPRGYVFNGIGASCLLLMCLTGLVIWWPGVSRLRQAVIVRFDRGWRRVGWELHGAAAIWSVALLIAWSVSGIYFSFPIGFRQAVERVMPLTPYVSFVSQPTSTARADLPLSRLVERSQRRVPGAHLARFGVPSGATGTYSVTLARGEAGDGDTNDEVTVYFDRYTGAELAIVDASRRTAGDVFLTWLGRVHVGNFGGWPVRLIWCAAGLILPLLFATGVTMWWNRTVRPRTRRAERAA